ncbi:OprD family outer membrane porin [Sulfurospirillum halorespirans]|uniref:Outer membrane porin n=1 Tax=Sulfurospirillum halorespirans DSM 13726 TaxID=1193502 RepID=A0A1D7TFX1_9BACT|nr:OprD family outer membrane porin [Sulfurospirillum halorespirans]AOO63830.1 outer membrane porin [Sulfurospirillum halorespirans DSM 13726]
MQIAKLSLVAAMVLGFSGSVYAADTLADAFKNGKVNGELKAWYWDRTKDVSGGTSSHNNENLINTAVVIKYVTDSFYGLKLGATFQGNSMPWAESGAKTEFKDEAGAGAVLSEAYIEYTLQNITAKIGRQMISTPLIKVNPLRIYTESFEGGTLINKDIPQTTLFAHYVDKFQGRSSYISDNTDLGSAPTFEKKVILGGAGTASYAFDGAYGVGLTNTSLQNLTLTAQYVQVNDVHMGTKKDDITMYYTEANYLLPMNNLKLGFDVNYRGSRTDSNLDSYNFEGNMLGLRLSLLDMYGFGTSVAYSTVSDNDSVIMGLGNGPTSYTALWIRGPYAYSSSSGMNAYKFTVNYDFAKAGVSGLIGELQYIDVSQDKPSVTTGISGLQTKANSHSDFTGYAAGLTYDIPAVKGLSIQMIYAALKKEATSATNVVTKTDTDELWFNTKYKF